MRKDENGKYVDDEPFDYKASLDKRLGPVKKAGQGTKSTSKFFSRFILGLGLVVILMLSGILSPNYNNPIINTPASEFDNYTTEKNMELSFDVTIYSSETCSCCHEYVAYLEDNGISVQLITDQDYIAVKDDVGVPSDLRSCHTTMVGNYFSEGHIPLSVINKMLEDQPAIDGIALAGMPAGSPGMGGVKDKDWNIYSIIDGEASSIYITI